MGFLQPRLCVDLADVSQVRAENQRLCREPSVISACAATATSAPACMSRGRRPLWQRSPVFERRRHLHRLPSREIRIQQGNGDRRIEPGDIHQPVYGGSPQPNCMNVVNVRMNGTSSRSADPKGPGIDIHRHGHQFEQMDRSDYCVSCHQVSVYPGIKLKWCGTSTVTRLPCQRA